MEPTLDLLSRLVEACGLELRIRATEIDWSGRSGWGDLDVEGRLAAVRMVGEFAQLVEPRE